MPKPPQRPMPGRMKNPKPGKVPPKMMPDRGPIGVSGRPIAGHPVKPPKGDGRITAHKMPMKPKMGKMPPRGMKPPRMGPRY